MVIVVIMINNYKWQITTFVNDKNFNINKLSCFANVFTCMLLLLSLWLLSALSGDTGKALYKCFLHHEKKNAKEKLINTCKLASLTTTHFFLDLTQILIWHWKTDQRTWLLETWFDKALWVSWVFSCSYCMALRYLGDLLLHLLCNDCVLLFHLCHTASVG